MCGSRRERHDQDAAIGAESRVLDPRNVVHEYEVARGDHQHALSLLVNHVSVRANLVDHAGRLDVAIVLGAVLPVVQAGENLHDWEVEEST